MTEYKYAVTGPRGAKYETTTLAEAKKLTRNGGSYRKVGGKKRNPAGKYPWTSEIGRFRGRDYEGWETWKLRQPGVTYDVSSQGPANEYATWTIYAIPHEGHGMVYLGGANDRDSAKRIAEGVAGLVKHLKRKNPGGGRPDLSRIPTQTLVAYAAMLEGIPAGAYSAQEQANLQLLHDEIASRGATRNPEEEILSEDQDYDTGIQVVMGRDFDGDTFVAVYDRHGTILSDDMGGNYSDATDALNDAVNEYGPEANPSPLNWQKLSPNRYVVTIPATDFAGMQGFEVEKIQYGGGKWHLTQSGWNRGEFDTLEEAKAAVEKKIPRMNPSDGVFLPSEHWQKVPEHKSARAAQGQWNRHLRNDPDIMAMITKESGNLYSWYVADLRQGEVVKKGKAGRLNEAKAHCDATLIHEARKWAHGHGPHRNPDTQWKVVVDLSKIRWPTEVYHRIFQTEDRHKWYGLVEASSAEEAVKKFCKGRNLNSYYFKAIEASKWDSR